MTQQFRFMTDFGFFFDTADHKYIEDKWALYSKHVSPKRVLGVTTNPNAFSKEGLNSIQEWEDRTRILCALVTKMRGGPGGSVHVQLPSDSLTPVQALAWATKVAKWTDGTTKICLKIPPYKQYLGMMDELSLCGGLYLLDVNITGVSDAFTALSCFLKEPNYVSIIPGRMEEMGVPAKDHVHMVMNAKCSCSKLITGSMRTLDGLKWCIEAGTIPTIGKRVFDLITPELESEVFGWQYDELSIGELPHGLVAQTEITDKLRKDFFIQMNELGRAVAEEFIQK